MADKQDGLYILMLSIHDLVRGENLELGRDADTGGQIKYVIELMNKLSKDNRVSRVDLLTLTFMCFLHYYSVLHLWILGIYTSLERDETR